MRRTQEERALPRRGAGAEDEDHDPTRHTASRHRTTRTGDHRPARGRRAVGGAAVSAVRRTVAVTASSAALVVLGACGEAGSASREAAVPSSSQPDAPSSRAPSDGGDQEWPEPARGAYDEDHPYVGMWVTEDDGVRQELLADGRYEEARGTTEKAYTGRYRVVGEDIYYVDDTGFTADGSFRDDVLYHGGMVMARR